MKYTLDEHKAKKLIVGNDLHESVGVIGKIHPDIIQQLSESAKGKGKRKLIVQMEAIHVGRTANYTFYTEQGLRDGLESWTHPYEKPVLTHHNAHRGEPIGRILRAEFSEATISGRKGLLFTCEITDPDAIEKVLDGRYRTVSIGASTDKVTCNICGTDRSKEWCEHWRGEEYEGQTCHYVIGTTMGREVSYVNVPADEDAGNISVTIDDGEEEGKTNESASLKIFQIAEGLMQDVDLPHVNLYESASKDVKSLVDGLLKLEEGSASNVLVDENGNPIDGAPNENTQNNLTVEEKLTAAEGKLEEAERKVADLEGKLAEAQTALSNTVIEKSKVDGLLKESQAEVERLTIENSDLIEKAHKALAEKVVDMKLALRKSDVVGVEYEEAVLEHIKRTEESLSDAVKDLQVEMKDSTAVRGSIPNPGAAGQDNQPGAQQEGNKDEKVSVEEAVGMFKNMFSRKK